MTLHSPPLNTFRKISSLPEIYETTLWRHIRNTYVFLYWNKVMHTIFLWTWLLISIAFMINKLIHGLKDFGVVCMDGWDSWNKWINCALSCLNFISKKGGLKLLNTRKKKRLCFKRSRNILDYKLMLYCLSVFICSRTHKNLFFNDLHLGKGPNLTYQKCIFAICFS